MTGTSVVGGLIAYINGSPTITSAYATGNVIGTGSDIAGFAGLGGNATITSAYATGNVTTSQGGDYVGGFVGQFDGDANNIHATGNVVSQSNEVGGLIGSVMRDAVISDAYATGSVTSLGVSVGGFVGELRGVISTSYASGAVSGSGAVGGFVGDDFVYPVNPSITDSYATGSVTGLQSANNSVVNYVGGFAGYNSNESSGSLTTTLTRDYATGLVSGVGTLGGFAGQNDGVITDSLWDRTSTGQTLGVGAPDSSNTGVGVITNLTSVQDTTPGAADYAFSTAPYTAAGFSFGTTPGGTVAIGGPSETWVQVDADGSFNGAGGATVGTRPFLLMEYSPIITNAHQLQLAALDLTANYTLGSDVDASGTAMASGMWGPAGFVPLAPLNNTSAEYTGTFDGHSHTIDGLYINVTSIGSRAEGLTGLFGLVGSGTIENVGLAGGSVSGGVTTVVGSLVGSNAGTLSNVYSTATVSSSDGGASLGGLVGDNTGTITGAYASGSVTGGETAGGLVGSNSGAIGSAYATGAVSGAIAGGLIGQNNLIGVPAQTFTNLYATGTVSGVYDAGGLIGENFQAALSGDSATGAVTGVNAVGGLVGYMLQGSIVGSHATGAVIGTETGTGGLVGVSDTGAISTSFATGQVTGGNDTGGLVGSAVGGTGAGITSSYATGNVAATSVSVGGLVGSSTANITGSYATGAVTGNQGVAGGLVGVLGFDGYDETYSATTLLDSYATGAVSGPSYIGGLVGRLEAQSSITGSGPQSTYASGLVTGTGMAAGGLVGQNYGTITQAEYHVAGGRSVVGVTGAADVGGVVGLDEAGSSLSNVSVFSGVLGTSYTGGVVGDNFGAVTGGGFGGEVTGGSGVGGIVGVNEGGASVTATGNFQGNNTVSGTGNDVGGVAGANFGTLGSSTARVFSAGSVTGVDHVGGLVGYNSGILVGTASDAVSGRDYVGGLVGLNYASIVGNASGTVKGADYVGGAVGWNDTQGSVFDSSSVAYVIATGDYAGGLVGVNKGSVSGSAVGPANAIVGSVTGTSYVGGLVGLNQGSISQSFSLVPVTGSLYLGGLVGWNDTGATVTTSYATGKVTGIAGGQEAGTNNDYVGGLVGVNFGSIANTYATGAVSGVQVVGGLVGTNMPGGASVTTSYATGAVSASGGAVGTTFGVQAGEVSYVYGFPSLSGQPVENGYTNAGSTGGGTDLTAAQEDGSAAYAGFDFTNTWQANSAGPPTLKPQAVNQ